MPSIVTPRQVIFDYAYDRFHQDRYGKDFWHVRVQAKEDASVTAQRQTMTAALLAYWHQVACFRSAEGNRQSSLGQAGGLAHWGELLGLSSVIGSLKTKTTSNRRRTWSMC